ncbi:hypothetical protein G5C65_34365 [Streptomyces sp. SB3404]|uniref:Uncharacterized protein n=1 Tax=Streptomyces boncukensis TaxID=2711219 RepID=A0A6G4X711_9ACTN|nr:hypothetical protein [Streptomyces boncukensis]NGO73329.1 hypothetical protein [Streptomyces boncukensis]
MKKSGPLSTEHESLEQLLGDCAQMAPHWRVTPRPGAAEQPTAHVPPRALHGVRVPRRYARLLDGMSDYGD